jgi:hypothetical protein
MKRVYILLSAIVLTLLFPGPATISADSAPQVELAVETATPRAVESDTEHSIVRDYTAAWKEMAEAFEQNSPDLLNAHFVDTAKLTLTSAVTEQRNIGVTSHYLDQAHRLKVLFYAPEGDVMELQDSVEYQLQVISDGKVIHDEHVVLKYLVLMTPSADRWVIRQIQSIPNSDHQ